ncbi:MAG: GNAT family N-acetyltransferase [Bacteroidales bacterium]|nr:GNAT family N-acetyltransferase [Bacteroidales bacterium]
MNNLTIRKALESETAEVLRFIKLLADYEKLASEVEATEETLHHSLFVRHEAEVVFAEVDDHKVGFALYFFNFSTFVGRKGLYLEDLFVLPEHRGRGYGKALLKRLATTALEHNCGRMEWVCLDWNSPSIDFYLSIGAKPMSDWTIYRLTETALRHFAE